MDTVKQRSSITPAKTRLASAFAKVLNIQAQKAKSREKLKRNRQTNHGETPSLEAESDEKLKDRLINQAFLAKLFASLSSIKCAYAQMQFAESPYDADRIQSSDQTIVSELKNLSELKQCYSKKLIKNETSSPERTLALAEIQEQRSLLKTYEVTIKKLDFQLKLKDSELTFLHEKLFEARSENELLFERTLNSIVQSHSELKTSHFTTHHRQAIKSIRAFVRVLVREMESAGWDLDSAASLIEPGVSFWRRAHKCFAFESYVCRHMFDGFEKSDSSKFASFCREKYLKLVHPRMEASFFGNLEQRELVGSGQGFPETGFFSAFCQMAKCVWLLKCLGSSFEPEEATVFRVAKGSRFSEVYMKSLSDEAFLVSGSGGSGGYPRVAFTVVPGFRVGKTVVQSQDLG
ncbi:Plant protein of unknown function (DUF641 [Striga hermonthica]|uniref:DUF641 domain-containing protein n=1 Tax=Striga hermonthica TaxID=68872 RepID=A0A9N7R6I0_STRHE|nr:Plant protein of unknown function (DUF641 [Striga hermonthica]